MFIPKLRSFIAMAAIAAFSLPASATAISSNAGWSYDQLDIAGGSTNGSPFTFSLGAGEKASFKVTDAFIPGDSFFLFSGSTLLASSSAFAGAPNSVVGDPNGENAWLSSSFEKLDYLFSGAGAYSFTVQGDGVAGVPAGLYVRLDVTNVPEPASMALLGLGLAALTATRRRKLKQ